MVHMKTDTSEKGLPTTAVTTLSFFKWQTTKFHIVEIWLVMVGTHPDYSAESQLDKSAAIKYTVQLYYGVLL